MKTRAITGFFFVIVMLGSMLLGPLVFGAFFLLLAVFALAEFYGLIKQSGYSPNRVIGIICGVIVFAVFGLIQYLAGKGWDFLPVKLVCLIPFSLSLIWLAELYKKSAAPFANIGYTLLGLIFTVVPFTFFHSLAYAAGGYNFHLPLGFMLMLWANDTGAFLTGRAFGKHKLFERHSPKKTWEGFIGGVLISAGVGLLLSHYYIELAWMHWVVIALIISCFGTLGDLVESMFKRSINIKDSGGILPGHGGLLDRFDGLLMAAPLVWVYLMAIA